MTEAELERLAILMEECAEVQQIIGKIMRHGYESFHPEDENRITNRTLLECELGDIEYICKLMINKRDVSRSSIQKFATQKEENIQQYLHHN